MKNQNNYFDKLWNVNNEASLEAPLRWKKPAMIFVNSMSDLFHENIPFEFIVKVFGVMALCEQHTFQVLTKRPERALDFFNWIGTQGQGLYNPNEEPDANIYYQFVGDIINKYHDNDRWDVGDTPKFILPNVWIGTSVENQEQADKRIPYLLQIPAAVRFLSCEPLLGEVDLTSIQCDRAYGSYLFNALTGKGRTHLNTPFSSTLDMSKLHWVIVGGESGHGARPMHPDWARKIRNDCQAAGVAFFFKQWGAWGDFTNKQVPEYGEDRIISKDGKLLGAGVNMRNGIGAGSVEEDWKEKGGAWMHKLTKKHTGRLLDGVEYSEYPNNEREITQ